MFGIIKGFFSHELYAPPAELVDSYFKIIRFTSNAPLPAQYSSLMAESALKAQNPH